MKNQQPIPPQGQKPPAQPPKPRSRAKMLLLAIVEGAVMVALAQVLSMLKLWEMPQGGSITLAMLPLCFYAVRWGVGEGLLASFVFGLLQLIFDGAYAWGWQSMLGDYLIAFTAIGLAGLGHRRSGGIFWGSLLGCMARYLVHYLTGVFVWGAYMPDVYCGLKMATPWVYSLIYNGIYMIPDTILVLVVVCLLNKPLGRYLNGAMMSPTFGFTAGGLSALVVGLIGIWYGIVTRADADMSAAVGTLFLVLGIVFAVGGIALLLVSAVRNAKRPRNP